ncbi:hypothetical protein BYT42DRAFT_590933 [Radiomyces spectabilis]|nr:hypothetical protein BYT42DRAFT_590933 [Radiomyces spectabilis]
MIGRADIEESKSNVAMNAWLPQASYPCGNHLFSALRQRRTIFGSLLRSLNDLYRTFVFAIIVFYPDSPTQPLNVFRSPTHSMPKAH